MFRTAWRGISPFLEHPKRQMASLIIISTFVGMMEAGVLVLVVHIALAIAEQGRSGGTDLPLIDASFSSGELLWVAAAMAVLSIVGHFFYGRLSARTTSQVSASARQEAIGVFFSASWSRQALVREGALQETMSSLVGRISSITGNLVTGISSFVNLVAFLIVAAIINPVAMIVVLGFGACLSLLLRPLNVLTRRRSASSVETNSTFVEEISRATSLAMEYRIFGVEDVAAQHLSQLAENAAADQFSRHPQVIIVEKRNVRSRGLIDAAVSRQCNSLVGGANISYAWVDPVNPGQILGGTIINDNYLPIRH